MLAIWKKLSLRYGSMFTKQYPQQAAARQEWAEVLGNVTGDEIVVALNNLPSSGPPNALEFRRLCRSAKIPKCHQLFRKALPSRSWEESRSLAKEQICRLREALN